jgi:SOS-response transcriptional repressor LexA
VSRPAKTFTPRQGQYLAFIHLYTRLHRRPPAETEMQDYFRVSPPSVHQMVLTLEQAGFIRRQPRTARSIELLVERLIPLTQVRLYIVFGTICAGCRA